MKKFLTIIFLLTLPSLSYADTNNISLYITIISDKISYTHYVEFKNYQDPTILIEQDNYNCKATISNNRLIWHGCPTKYNYTVILEISPSIWISVVPFTEVTKIQEAQVWDTMIRYTTKLRFEKQLDN